MLVFLRYVRNDVNAIGHFFKAIDKNSRNRRQETMRARWLTMNLVCQTRTKHAWDNVTEEEEEAEEEEEEEGEEEEE